MYATLTCSRRETFGRIEAREVAEALSVWRPPEIDHPNLQRLWLAEDRHQFSWRDSLIAAVAQGCARQILLTENLQFGQVFDGVRIVDRCPSAGPRPGHLREMH